MRKNMVCVKISTFTVLYGVICGERERRMKEELKSRLEEVKSRALEEENRRKGR